MATGAVSTTWALNVCAATVVGCEVSESPLARRLDAANNNGTAEATGTLGSVVESSTACATTGDSAVTVVVAVTTTGFGAAGCGSEETWASVRAVDSSVVFVAGLVVLAVAARELGDSASPDEPEELEEPEELDEPEKSDGLDDAGALVTAAALGALPGRCLRAVDDTFPPVDTTVPAGAGRVPAAGPDESTVPLPVDPEDDTPPLLLECPAAGADSPSSASVFPPVETGTELTEGVDNPAWL